VTGCYRARRRYAIVLPILHTALFPRRPYLLAKKRNQSPVQDPLIDLDCSWRRLDCLETSSLVACQLRPMKYPEVYALQFLVQMKHLLVVPTPDTLLPPPIDLTTG